MIHMFHSHKWWQRKSSVVCHGHNKRNWNCSSLCRQMIGCVFEEEGQHWSLWSLLNGGGNYGLDGLGWWISCWTAASTHIYTQNFLYRPVKWLFFQRTNLTSKREQLFTIPIRPIKGGEAGESTGDSWVLVTNRAPAGRSIDPRLTTFLTQPLNGWLLMRVLVWECVCETVSKDSLFSLWLWEENGTKQISSYAGYSVNAAFSFAFFTQASSQLLNADGALILERCSAHPALTTTR